MAYISYYLKHIYIKEMDSRGNKNGLWTKNFIVFWLDLFYLFTYETYGFMQQTCMGPYKQPNKGPI
jgi:hypothetical protein